MQSSHEDKMVLCQEKGVSIPLGSALKFFQRTWCLSEDVQGKLRCLWQAEGTRGRVHAKTGPIIVQTSFNISSIIFA